jgi:hypothetical protein
MSRQLKLTEQEKKLVRAWRKLSAEEKASVGFLSFGFIALSRIMRVQSRNDGSPLRETGRDDDSLSDKTRRQLSERVSSNEP